MKKQRGINEREPKYPWKFEYDHGYAFSKKEDFYGTSKSLVKMNADMVSLKQQLLKSNQAAAIDG